MDLSDKVIVVTGGSRGLGQGLAEVALAAGARVGVCSRTDGPWIEQPRLLQQCLDVRDGVAIDGFAERVAAAFGHVDLWVNNAGQLGPVGLLREAPAAEMADALAVNVLGVMLGSRAYARLCMRSGRAGVLLNISSGAARKAYAGWSTYCASKAAVDRLSEVIALEEAGRLRVHAVAPGVVDTAMQDQVRGMSEALFPDVERFKTLHRTGALVTPETAAWGLLRLAFESSVRPDAVCVDLRDLPDATGN
jgi:NAD(P)-dependent dehydrogenase (short-subunit alcohol dehydrogenase family)